MSNRQIVFFASPAHAGTTLIELILGSHLNCFSLGEFHNVINTSVWKKVPSCSVCGFDCEFWANFAKNRMKMQLHEAAFKSAPIGTKILTDSSKPIDWILKSMRQIRGEYNWKVINLIRNPYGSLLHKRTQFNIDVNSQHVTFWINRISQQLQFASAMPNNVFTVKYEDFCLDPDEYLKKICDFIGMDYDSRMKKFWQWHHHIHSGNSTPVTMIQIAHNIQFRHDPPLPECYTRSIEKFIAERQITSPNGLEYQIRLDERYKELLSKEEKQLITKMTLPLLKRLGYSIEK